MDEDFLDDAAVVASTRNWICIRVASYEDPEEAEELARFYATRSVGHEPFVPGQLPNTTVALLSSDGGTKLSCVGRDPYFILDNIRVVGRGAGDSGSPTRRFASLLDSLAAELGTGQDRGLLPGPETLPQGIDLRRSLNVAACDDRPLVVLWAAEPDARAKLEREVARLAWSDELVGRLQYIVVEERAELELLPDLAQSGADGLWVVQPGTFGLAGTVLAEARAGRRRGRATPRTAVRPRAVRPRRPLPRRPRRARTRVRCDVDERGAQVTLTRRGFLGAAVASSAAWGGVSPSWGVIRREEPLSVALVGCGRQGTRLAARFLEVAAPAKLVAVADLFPEQIDATLTELAERLPAAVEVPAARRFLGFDAYRRAIEAGVDLVLLATPPGFRPYHFETAVELGVHAFLEKPVAVDALGVRRVLSAGRAAETRGLRVGVGLQRRHSERYRETVARVQGGAIGLLHTLRCTSNTGAVWRHERTDGQSELEYQLRNWYYFTWLGGDLIVEQHVDGLDVANWVAGALPVEARGQGGRIARTGPEHGQIYDHHAVEFFYPGGVELYSQCRQIPDTWGEVNEYARGTRGEADLGGGVIERNGAARWSYEPAADAPPEDAFGRQLAVLARAIREGRSHNEAIRGATSTMTAILGRMASYSGKRFRWEDAATHMVELAPGIDELTWESVPPVVPNADGRYPISVPGQRRSG